MLLFPFAHGKSGAVSHESDKGHDLPVLAAAALRVIFVFVMVMIHSRATVPFLVFFASRFGHMTHQGRYSLRFRNIVRVAFQFAPSSSPFPAVVHFSGRQFGCPFSRLIDRQVFPFDPDFFADG